MKWQVLEYPLLLELPKSIIGGQYASVSSKKTSKVVQTTMAVHLIKKRFCSAEHLKDARGHKTVEKLTSSGGFLTSFTDLHKWQVILKYFQTSKNRAGRVPSHEPEGSRIPTAHWTPQLYPQRKKCHSLEQNNKSSRANNHGASLGQGLFWPMEHLKRTREHETVDKHWTSIGGFLTSSKDLNKTFLQHPKSGKKAFISWRSRSSNTHCPLNSPNPSLEDNMLAYEAKKQVK